MHIGHIRTADSRQHMPKSANPGRSGCRLLKKAEREDLVNSLKNRYPRVISDVYIRKLQGNKILTQRTAGKIESRAAASYQKIKNTMLASKTFDEVQQWREYGFNFG
ncbi:hypothetical protein CPX83_11255 [Salmonella enterica subsp. enterica serovar Typhimurium]|uniref:hypothetical protein n=1 Tax=Salmonella enterica TaxID=28901 RepID=UPI00071AC024|nr:hypothetical protein [Salmonella enterica]EBG6971113.1 hypothetical protein [Salmonella enterica subsp. enterica]ECD3769639.1 hypothetical protein [Salmonella enterica subsp. enterica serovar Onderstepoort]ECE8818530.1 hypothetical protein [Salmonella enterica subsp. enterica serovar Reading]EDL1508966.1 hypothetical protein [Salmonella enterica subsp. enterica serovar Typhimurium]AXD07275.1 hypothetical protein LFZ28_25010 [Salmonella enterica subsp. enterica serovar Milwaukee str. SA19950